MPPTPVQSHADATHAKRPRSPPAHPTFITTTTDVSSSSSAATSPSLSLASCNRGYRRYAGSHAHPNSHAHARPHRPTCWWQHGDLHLRRQPFRTAAFLLPSLSQPVKPAANSCTFSASSCTFSSSSSSSTSRRTSRVRLRAHPLSTILSTSRTPSFSSTFTPGWHHASHSHPHVSRPQNNTDDLPSSVVTFITDIVATARSSEQLRENLTDVSDAVIRAVETLSRRQPRQTVADIAATAGISLSSASDEAVKLASLTGAAIDVSDAGDLAYKFPSDVRAVLRGRSARAAAAMFWRRIAPAVFTAARVGFGALLVLSIVITFVALAVLSAASTRDDDNRRGDSRSMSFFGPRLFFGPDIFDIIFYSQRSAARRRYYEQYGGETEKEEGMSFLEAVYSFVFGDGDPNVDFDDRRWRNVAAVIRANRGAVTADQLAPLLDPPPMSSSSSVVDKSFMLPALTRFQGCPEVTDDGDIVYVFPQFLTTGSASSSSSTISSSPSVEIVGQRSIASAVERQETLTQASPSQRALVVTLGVINVLGVALLGAKMATVIPMTRDAAQFIGFVRSVYPALCAYAASFVAAPILRALRMRGRNKEIKERNRAREERARVLLRLDDEDVRRKMKAAERRALQQNRVGDGQGQSVVYSSDRDAVDQVNMQEELKDDFDRRLNG